MQNHIQKFEQSSIVFGKPRILFENLKSLTSSNYPIHLFFTFLLITQDLNKIKKIRKTLL